MLHHVFRVKAATAFFAVLLLSLFAIPAFAGQASLAWNASASSNVTGYKVHYGTASRSYSTHLDVGGALSATVPNLTAGTTYYFAVTAYNAAGESGYSNEASAAIPKPDSQAPTAPTNPAAFSNGTTAINLNWTASTDNVGVSGYRVERCQGAGCTNFAQAGAPTGTSYSDTGLTAGTSYSYRVRASDAAGNLSGYSAVATASTTAATSPLAADFTASRTVGSAPMTVAFTDASTGVVSSYAWNFGDGTSSNAKNPSHIYTKSGAYSVSLTVGGAGGNKTTTKSGLVKVGIDNDLIVDSGSTGIWKWLNNTTWSRLDTRTSKSAILADVDHNGQQDQVVDFGSATGIWMWMNNSAWVPLHVYSAVWMLKADVDGNGLDDLVVDFGAQAGIWIFYNGSSWHQLTTLTAKQAIVADVDHNGRDDIVIDFGATYGLRAHMNGGSVTTAWRQLDVRSPDWMIKADVDHNGQDDLVMSFGAGTGTAQTYPGKGIWAYLNGGTGATPWRQLDWGPFASTRAIAIDIDNNGQDDLIIDYLNHGLWAYLNDAFWRQLHVYNSKYLAKADLDGNGESDLVVDFGPRDGIFALMNYRAWTYLGSSATGAGIVAGQIDGR